MNFMLLLVYGNEKRHPYIIPYVTQKNKISMPEFRLQIVLIPL